MSLAVHLLGRPRLVRPSGETYQFRSRKSWAVLAYLILSERPPTRGRLASSLFGEADDPGRALRWSLSEIRRGLGDDGSVDGEPVVLALADDVTIDVNELLRGSWRSAVDLPGLGADLLEGMTFQATPAFDAWLLSEQRRMAAASESMLHEGALGSMSHGDLDRAIRLAVRVTQMNPLDENHHALLIRLYRLAGDNQRAARQFAACTEILERELGVLPGPAVSAALQQVPPAQVGAVADQVTIEALIESGTSAVAAGAVQSGVQSLRAAARLADAADAARLRVAARLSLAEALVHSMRGFDEEGLAALYEADDISLQHGFTDTVARIRAEIGYVDYLRARYDRAEVWLTDALHPNTPTKGSVSEAAKVTTYLGSVESDRANYPRAIELLTAAVELSRAAGDQHREAYAIAMLGRVNIFLGDLDAAAGLLDQSIALSEREHWLAFLPFPQALRGEVQLARRDRDGAAAYFRQAFARACQLGDPCWEGISGRGLALVAELSGDSAEAFRILQDARVRSNRHADPYVWLDGYILDAQCTLGRRHDHPDTGRWIAELRKLASRTGMREFTVRSLLHGAAMGDPGDAAAAELLAADLIGGSPGQLVEC